MQPPARGPANIPAEIQVLNKWTVLDFINQFRLTDGNAGTWASFWKPITATKSKFLFTGLEGGKEYGCRVAVIGVRQQMVYSDVVTRIAV